MRLRAENRQAELGQRIGWGLNLLMGQGSKKLNGPLKFGDTIIKDGSLLNGVPQLHLSIRQILLMRVFEDVSHWGKYTSSSYIVKKVVLRKNLPMPVTTWKGAIKYAETPCWTYFTLGRASAAVKNIVGPIPPISPSVAPPGSLRKMLLDVFHSRPRQRCC
jgi:hypothetical protein